MPRVILEGLAPTDDLKVGLRKASLLMVLEHALKGANVLHYLPTHLRPAHGNGILSAFTADVHDVVLDLLRSERARLRALALRLITSDGPGRFQVEPCLKEAFQNGDPRII